jgi:hypothetical protein
LEAYGGVKILLYDFWSSHHLVMNDKIQAPGVNISGRSPFHFSRMLRWSTTTHPDPRNVLAYLSRYIPTDCHLLLLSPSNVTGGRKQRMSALGEPINVNILESHYYFLDLACIFL